MPKVKFIPGNGKLPLYGSLWGDPNDPKAIYLLTTVAIPNATNAKEMIHKYALVNLKRGITYNNLHSTIADAIRGFEHLGPCKIKVKQL